jgi:serine/threonine protein kinase/tetratricopeptide (TPR) repeat protein
MEREEEAVPVDPERVQAIFLEAAEQGSPVSRAAVLDRACGADAELRERVETLLRAHDAPGAFLESRVPGPVTTLDEPITERPGTLIGPYKLLEQIGEGGFGVVFMAEQTEPVRRKVALKVLKPGMDSRPIVARFEAERQALALMDHPNIAKVHDGGATASGRPYFVMELVKGVPITEFCDQNLLAPRQRLELFMPVCQAVQHAHQKGIIHRDLKPSNVLVSVHDTTPVPKIIDFGVAKALGQELTDKTLFTGFAQMIGTPLYMSPEQAGQSGLDIDTRSDIYSLGVLLYELLTGTTPFTRRRFKQAAYDEICRILREEEPPKPSTRLSESKDALPSISAQRHMEPAKLTKLVRGELDWIVMKALEKDRNRRYETADGFAKDVQRYLADEPVQACPPSAWYRFRKLARRHKGAFAVVAAVVFFVLVTIAGLVVNNRLVTREKVEKEQALDRALREKERADANLLRARKAVKDYLTEAAANPLLKEADFHDLRQKLLESALPFYQEFLKQQSDDPELEAERARAYGDLARIREDLGQLEQALAGYEQQRAISERLAADFPSQPAYRHGLAQSYRNVANLHHGSREHAKAEEAYRQAIRFMEALTAEYPASAPYREELAGVCNNLGVSLRARGQLKDAKAMHQRALELCERLTGEHADVPAYRRDLAQSHYSLGTVFGVMAQHGNALTSHERAAELLQELADDFPKNPDYRKFLAVVLNNKGIVLWELGRFADGLVAQKQALGFEEKLADDFPSVPGYRRDVATSLLNAGELLNQLGRHAEALTALDKGSAILERLILQSPRVAENRQCLALAQNNRGEVLRKLGRPRDALEAYQKAQVFQEKLAADFPALVRPLTDLAMTYSNQGDLLNELGHPDEASAVLEKAIALCEKQARDHPTVPAFVVGLAAAYLNMGDSQMARRRFDVALDWFTKTLTVVAPVRDREPQLALARDVAWKAHANRAQALDKLGRYAEALQHFDQALALADARMRAGIRLQRATALVHSGDTARATAEADALAAEQDAQADTLYDTACIYARCASAARGDAKRADPFATRAVELLRRAVKKGYKDAARLKNDPDLDALRAREDFKKVLQEVQERPAGAERPK